MKIESLLAGKKTVPNVSLRLLLKSVLLVGLLTSFAPFFKHSATWKSEDQIVARGLRVQYGLVQLSYSFMKPGKSFDVLLEVLVFFPV